MARMKGLLSIATTGSLILVGLRCIATETNPTVPLKDPATRKARVRGNEDASRIPGNRIFDLTGVLVNDASAFPADRYAGLLRKAAVKWIALQIDNGGQTRSDNVASVNQGWAKAWR